MLVQFLKYNAPPKPRLGPQFMDLPLEIRELIWEYSLTEERVFHIKEIKFWPATSAPIGGRIQFHQEYRPPVVTQVCSESRKVAWRIGCFLFTRPGHYQHPGIWFNPKSDILYIDRNQRNALVTEGTVPGVVIPGLDRVENVALEWRWFLQDGSKRLEAWSSEDMQLYWAHKMDKLYAYLPSMKNLRYILPLVRHQGGLPWGREPRTLLHYPIALTELPPEIIVPIESGHKPWVEVEEELAKTLGSAWQCDDKKSKFGERVAYPPEIIGQWLLRKEAPTSFEYSTVRAFTR
jgi:2EXR family